MKKGFNIDVTRGQYMMLYNIMCEHNQMVNPQANPDFDMQTFDNLFQAITMAKETYLKWFFHNSNVCLYYRDNLEGSFFIM